MAKHFWSVTIPIAGHVVVEVSADTEDTAIKAALEMDIERKDIEYFECLQRFHAGNICYCPHPWEATAEDVGEDDDNPPLVPEA